MRDPVPGQVSRKKLKLKKKKTNIMHFDAPTATMPTETGNSLKPYEHRTQSFSIIRMHYARLLDILPK